MIQIQQLYKSFNEQQVLRGIDLEIPTDAITVLLGPSGTGKSVLLKLIIGLMKPDSGRIVVDGTDITALTGQELNQVRKKFGMLFQSAALFDSLTVAENIAFPLREHSGKTDAEITAIVEEKLALVDLSGAGNKLPSQLSGGMRKRVGLARAIALEPRIVLYDEPTTGLDPITRDAINDLIVKMQQKLRVTSIIISHDIESTFRVAHKVAVLNKGKIIAVGSPEVVRHSEEPLVQHFLGHGQL